MSEASRKILVHACCGPCALEPIRALRAEGYEPTILWSNPNIQPRAEYERRLATLRGWAEGEGIDVVVADGEDGRRELWERVCAPKGFRRRERCRACYALRLGAAADAARELGFSTIATTLAVSPHQLFETCDEVLGAVAASRGLEALHRDWRPRYPEATRRARELGLYRQNYCGCRFSAAEAQRERQRARDARKAERARQRGARSGHAASAP